MSSWSRKRGYGHGLERALCVLNGKSSVYETDIFADAIEKISQLTGRTYGADEETTRAFRVVLDHVRTATFMIGDEKGISPSNTDQGYILRRIIRRAVRYGRKIDLPEGSLSQIAATFVEKYKAVYPELETNRARIAEELEKEEAKFSKTLQQGLKEFEKCIGGLERKNAFYGVEGSLLRARNGDRGQAGLPFVRYVRVPRGNHGGNGEGTGLRRRSRRL